MPGYLRRTVRFPAVHYYGRPDWSAEENRRRFGDLTEPHGHAYRCTVTVSGPLAPDTAMIMDLGDLDRLVAEEVLERWSGRTLNEVLDTQPTCEALARDAFGRLASRLPAGIRLVSVGIAEDDSLSAEYHGD